MINALIGRKDEMFQLFLENGTRIPVTSVAVGANSVLQVKTVDKDRYSAAQLGFGVRTKINKPLGGLVKKAGAKNAPSFIKEVRVSDKEELTPGDSFSASQVFEPGDVVNVEGVSKGKGFAGVVKRHHFKGGPRTHGQSDRERAPGSIGQTTTPGRVYKGKRMAGRMGHVRVTVKNLKVMDVLDDKILIRGLLPGGRNSMVFIQKVGKDRKFVPLYKEAEKTEKTEEKEDKKEKKE